MMFIAYSPERYHDVGGRIDGPLNLSAPEYEPWEKDIDAIHFMLGDAKRKRIFLEEFRRALTLEIGADRYLRLDFYERWALAVEILLVEKGIVESIDVGEGFVANVFKDPFKSRMTPTADADIRARDRREAQIRVGMIKSALISKGIITEAEIQAFIGAVDSKSDGREGARVVVRAWTDPEFKKALLKDANPAIRMLGIDLGFMHICVIENKPNLHNLIVCTLCSCYPRYLLGRPPQWYKTLNYRSRAVREPRVILKELGLELPETTRVRVHDSSADLRYLVLPLPPENLDQLRPDELIGLVTRDGMVGAAAL